MLTDNDCFRVCIACILDISETDLPTPPVELTAENWVEYAELLQTEVRRRGYAMLTLKFDRLPSIPKHALGYSIASYASPSGDDILHCVVCKDGEFLWDPSPVYRVQGVTYAREPEDWIVFQALDPAAFIYRQRWPSLMAEEITGETA
jgi:hypothetical protein